jgi:hypothetical protein
MARARLPGKRTLWTLAVAVGAAALVWSAVDRAAGIQRSKIADAVAWDVRGPECRRITEAEFLSGREKGPQGFHYEAVGFYRREGNAECASIYEDGGRGEAVFPVCQFTKPNELLVRTAAGDWYFAPGPRQPATLSVRAGQPRCVLGVRKKAKAQ